MGFWLTDLRVWDVGFLGLRVPKLTLWCWVFIQPLQVFACSERDCGFRGSKEVGSQGILQGSGFCSPSGPVFCSDGSGLLTVSLSRFAVAVKAFVFVQLLPDFKSKR